MHTYRKVNNKWQVGYYTMEANSWYAGGGAQPAPLPVVSVWQLLSEHDNEQIAIDRVNYLNGGAVVV